jgi:hypothetical protein
MASRQVLASFIVVSECSMVVCFRNLMLWYESAGLKMYLHINSGFLGNSTRDTTSSQLHCGT